MLSIAAAFIEQGEGSGLNDPWEDSFDYIDERLAKALSHPLRVQILVELNKRVMSPSRFSERFEEPLTKVSYHFDVLAKLDCLELVHEEPRGNLIEHYYRATKKALFDGEAWDNLPETIRNKLSGRTISDLLGAVAESMLAETFDSRIDRHVAWQMVHLDEQGWKETSDIQLDAARKLVQTAKESRSRLIRSGELGLMATWGVLLFESPFPDPEPTEGP
jgi:DNA-binding transcriptional ArsR family regulator